MKAIKNDFTLMAVLLIPVAIAINMIGGQVAVLLKIPVYLDSIGTILIAILAGPWVGALAGFLSNAVGTVIDPIFLPYSLVQIAVGLGAGFLAKRGMFKTMLKTVLSGAILAVIATIIAVPITVYLFGGVTGSGSTLITGVLLASGQDLMQAVLTAQGLSDLADKIISVIVSYIIINSMSSRYLSKFNLGHLYMKKGK